MRLDNFAKTLHVWQTLIDQVKGDYQRAHGCLPSIFRPRRFTEKMQWRKLFELDPMFAIFCDKLAVRGFVEARLGPDYLIPLLWSGPDPEAIPLETLSSPYVIKSNHAAGQTMIVHRNAAISATEVRQTTSRWLAHCHGTAMCEPGYVGLPRQLMVEAMLFGPGNTPPTEYKLFVFAGRVRVILSLVVAEDRIARQAAFYSPSWEPLGWSMVNVPSQPALLPPPRRLAEMIRIAERLGRGLSHLRVDLYDTDAGVRVGELTLYTWSGHEPYRPATVDQTLGDFWPIRFPFLKALWTISTKRHPVRPRNEAAQ